MVYKCPVCSYNSTDYLNVARHMYGRQGDDTHDDWMEPRIEAKGISIFQFLGMPGNMKLLAQILEEEDTKKI